MAGDLYASDENDGKSCRAAFREKRSQKKASMKGTSTKFKKHVQEFDTNVFQVDLDCLQTKTEVATGDAIIC